MDFLVAVDGSAPATNALEYALDLAAGVGATVTVVHAVDPSVYDTGGSDPISGIADADERLVIENVEVAEERGFDVLEDASAVADARDQTVETELLYGDPVTAITDYADDLGAHTIVVGHQGRAEHLERLLGSVAKSIVERATIPVTVVR